MIAFFFAKRGKKRQSKHKTKPLFSLLLFMSGNFELHHWRPQSRPKSLMIPDSLHLDPLTTPSSSNGCTSLSELVTSPIVSNTAINSLTDQEPPQQAGRLRLSPADPLVNQKCSSGHRGLNLSLILHMALLRMILSHDVLASHAIG